MRHVPNISYVALGLIFAFAAILLGADAAYAQGTVGSFSCSGGVATGQLYNSGGSCPTTLTMNNMFSFLVCNMEQLSSNLMGHMYCGMIKSLEPAVWAAATLAVLVFGISFTIGLIPATGRDAILFLLKLAFITGFATNADLLIGVGYNLLISGIKDGVEIVLTGIGTTAATDAQGIYALLDTFIAKSIHFATDSVGVTADPDRCKNAVFAVLATMMVAFPMLAYLGLLLIGRLAITFFRAIFGYVYALVGITFLLTLAPFFLCFYFFKETTSFFDKWLAYLVSFALQIVLLFAALAFVLLIQQKVVEKSMLNNLTAVIMYNQETLDTTSFRFPWEYCTLCDFEVVKRDPSLPDDAVTNSKLQCKPDRKPISLTFAMAPDKSIPATTTASASKLNALINVSSNGILALLVLAVIVERLIAHVPYLAQFLGGKLGATYAPQLGGGGHSVGTPMHAPGDGLVRDFSTGFDRGFGNLVGGGDGVSKTARGVRDGFSAMISGEAVRRDASGNVMKDADGKEIMDPVTMRDGRGNTVTDGQGNPVQAGFKSRGLLFISDPNRSD